MTERVKAEMFCAMSDINGVNTPKSFVNAYGDQLVAYEKYLDNRVKLEIKFIREHESDHELMDDTWEYLLEHALLVVDGKRYTLHQDGEVHAIPFCRDIDWVPDEDELISDDDLDKRYAASLDECYGVLKVCGHEYSSSRLLREVDETAYRCGFNDWLDAEVSEHTIYEHNDSYSYADITEPCNLAEYFLLNQEEEHHGAYMWKSDETLATNKLNDERMQDPKTWEIEFESNIPAHQTMENH